MTDDGKPKIVALVGMPGTGKSTVREVFEEHDYKNVYFGGIVVGEVKARGQDVNETNERVVREELRSKEGMGVMALRSIPKIQEILDSGQNVIIDDLYSYSEYRILEDKYGSQFVTIAIASPRQQRYARLEGRTIRPLTKEEAVSRDYAEVENIEKGGPIALADFTVLNDGSEDELKDKIRTLISQI